METPSGDPSTTKLEDRDEGKSGAQGKSWRRRGMKGTCAEEAADVRRGSDEWIKAEVCVR